MVRKNFAASSSSRLLKITGVVRTKCVKMIPAISRLKSISVISLLIFYSNGDPDETRTRNLRRDRAAF